MIVITPLLLAIRRPTLFSQLTSHKNGKKRWIFAILFLDTPSHQNPVFVVTKNKPMCTKLLLTHRVCSHCQEINLTVITFTLRCPLMFGYVTEPTEH